MELPALNTTHTFVHVEYSVCACGTLSTSTVKTHFYLLPESNNMILVEEFRTNYSLLYGIDTKLLFEEAIIK